VTRASEIRKQILKQRGVEFNKLTRKVKPVQLFPAPFSKSSLMQLLESRHNTSIESLISTGTIYEVGRVLDVSPSTISKWRKLISEARDKEFFEQF